MKIRIILFLLILSISKHVFSQSEIFGLATPIQLNLDTTIVYLEDYFVDVNKINKIEAPAGFEQKLSGDKKYLTLIANNNIAFLSELKITTSINQYSILLKKSKKQKIHFAFNPEGKIYKQVSIVGEMTNWNPNVQFMQFENGRWSTDLVLNPGRYQYQIVADGNWFLDPNNQDSIDNGIGGYNSLMKIGIESRAGRQMLRTNFLISTITDGDTLKNILSFCKNENNIKLFILWENNSVDPEILPGKPPSPDNLMGMTIPRIAYSVQRSFIRVYGYDEFGELNDFLIPLEYGKVITDPSTLTRDDLQTTIMYFMMVDRFNNGDKSNDNPVNDPRVLPQANYYGGDLAGIQQKIDDGYFENLGINTLWISPVFQNPYNAYQEFPEPHRWFSGYHGYWPISLSQVDTRFGSNTIFKSLVDDAHQNHFNVYLDYVANHIHEQHPLWKQHPEWFSNLTLPDGRLNLRLWDEQRLTTWFEPYMPSFDHSNPIVAEACADSAMWWLTEFNLDGFRHDATKHIETEFWRLLTYKIKTEVEIPQHRNIYQIGETFGSRELIGSYLGSGLLNAQFDFDLYFDERSAFANDDVSFSRLASSLQETFDYFGYHHLMGNITGNHDMARFISYASGDLKWDENDKEAGWQRDIEVTNPVGYSKLKMLHAFNMTIPGIPIIYYGDEIGLPGANDPDNRRMMQFDSLNKYQLDVKNTVSYLTKLRSEHMALLYGDFEIIYALDDILMYRRQYFDDVVYVIFNKSDQQMRISVPLKPGEVPMKMETTNSTLELNSGSADEASGLNLYPTTIQAYSFEIIILGKNH